MTFVIGALYAAGFYMMLRRSLFQLAMGLVLLSHAVNLLMFTAAGMVRGRPPLVPAGALRPTEPYADPLPQALILTAIVINFGMVAFTLVLARRAQQATGTDDVDGLTATDR